MVSCCWSAHTERGEGGGVGGWWGGGYARVVKGLERGTRGWGSNPDSVRQIKKTFAT